MKLRKVSWSTRQRRTCSSERKGEIGSHGGTVHKSRPTTVQDTTAQNTSILNNTGNVRIT